MLFWTPTQNDGSAGIVDRGTGPLSRKQDAEVGTPPPPVEDQVDVSAVRLDELPGDGESHAAPALLAAEKRIEDHVADLSWDPWPVVGEDEFGLVIHGRKGDADAG